MKQEAWAWFYLSPTTGCIALHLTFGFFGSWFLTIKGIGWPLLSATVLPTLTFYDSRIFKNLIIGRPRSIFAMNQRNARCSNINNQMLRGKQTLEESKGAGKAWYVKYNAEIEWAKDDFTEHLPGKGH